MLRPTRCNKLGRWNGSAAWRSIEPVVTLPSPPSSEEDVDEDADRLYGLLCSGKAGSDAGYILDALDELVFDDGGQGSGGRGVATSSVRIDECA